MTNFSDSLSRLLYQADWGSSSFGESVLKAELKKQLHKIRILDDNNKISYLYETIDVDEKSIGYFTSDDRRTYQFAYGEIMSSDDKIQFLPEKNFPPFAKLVTDYLLGKYVFKDQELYDVTYRQFKKLDEFALQSKYGFKDSNHILEILQGIHQFLKIDPVNKIQSYQIACDDFIIDLETNTIIEQVPAQNVSYFKYFPVELHYAKAGMLMADDFLSHVIADEKSLHNAKLQAYYMAQVACGIRPKTNFFISKSGVRTGKGLRHIALSGLFKKIDVELDILKSSGFEALQGWAMFYGGEMALATEQGDIQGNAMERVLKIIATEKTHIARAIGQNQSLVNLTGVLCIDTNRTVALSDEMNGRKVLIQYKNRPVGETDIEREEFFFKYWQSFTNKDKSPKLAGSLGFLLSSMKYFKEQDCRYMWKAVEVFNDIDIDDFQLALINALQEVEFVRRTDNKDVIDLSKVVYGNNRRNLGKALAEIGVKSVSKKVNGQVVRGYVVENKDRFDMFVI